MIRTTTIAVLLLFATACAPRYPNDADHQNDDSCVECHFHGEGPDAPDDHWDGGGNVTWDHQNCGACHIPR